MDSYRQQQIMARARSDGRVLVEPLARHFGVTVQTIRRDLAQLCDAGLLARVHGGAVLPSGTRNIGYEDRRGLNLDAKEAIGRVAAAQITPGASVFLDIGTTAEAVARALLRHTGLLVVTNNINVANILVANPEAEIVLAGGLLRRSDGGLVGEATVDVVRQFKVDTAVIGCSAMDEDGDVLDFDFREVRVAQAVMETARRRILVADHSKLARSAPVRIGTLRAFDLWVTDARPPERLRRRIADWDTDVVVAAARPYTTPRATS
jgi:DeoR family glycerol-3-phosphate regulon repressor